MTTPTYQELTELHDDAINNLMSRFYPVENTAVRQKRERKNLFFYTVNYFEDYELILNLAKQNNLEVNFSENTEVFHEIFSGGTLNKNPIRAICEMLLMIAVREAQA